MAKRANGEGTISKRTRDGKVVGWRGSVTVGHDAQGRQVRRWVSGKTQAEVQEGMRRLQSELHQGLVTPSEKLTVSAYLDQWLQNKERDQLKPNTLRSYRDSVRLHLKPLLGKRVLEKLRPLDVEQMLTQLHQAGKSPAVLAYSLRVLKMALRQAVQWQLVARNVAEAVRPPRRSKPKFHVWEASEVVHFLQVTEAHRLHAAFYLALMTGMRRGEILGLQWTDIDWERKRLQVCYNLVEVRAEGQPGKVHRGKPTVSSKRTTLQTPKTDASQRVVALSDGTLQKLREHQRRQEAERCLIGLDRSEQGFVFANELGQATEPRTLYGWYRQLVKQAGVRRIRFHDLRHTAASLMIHKGLPPKTVADRLGHTDVAFTLRVYAHLYDGQRQEAAMDLADLLPSGNGSPN